MFDPSQKLILLVEDDAIIALAEAESVRSFGYSVLIAHSGEEAIEITAENTSISLILMDIDLGGGIDGPDAARRILQTRRIPIVFLTSHSEKDYVARVKEITRYGYIIKDSGDFVLSSSIDMAFHLFELTETRRESEAALKKTQALAHIGSWIWHIKKDRVSWSDEMYRLYGIERESFTGSIAALMSEAVHSDDRGRIEQFFSAVRDGGAETPIDCRIVWPDSSVHTIYLEAGEITRDEHGIPVSSNGFAQDITERKISETALKQSQRLLNEMGRISKIGAWRTNVDTQEILWTEELFQIYEIEPSVRPNLDLLLRLYTGASRQRLMLAVEHTMETGEPFDIEVDFVSPKGNKRRLRIIGKAEYTDGRITHRTGITQDITGQKQIENALRRNSEVQTVLREIVDAAVTAPSMGELYRTVHHSVGRVLPAQLFHINILDSKTKEIIVPYRADDVNTIPARRPLGKGMTEYIMKLGKAAYVPPEELNRLREIGEYTLYSAENVRVRHYLGAPLIDSKGKAFGVMSMILMGETHFIPPEDVEVLSIIAAQVSMAIERKMAEENIKSLLSEKELLLKEVQHRIKNNMSIMMSLLSLQANAVKDEATATVLRDAQSRFRSMGVLYDRLFNTESLREMSIKEYLPLLIDDIVSIFANREQVVIETEIEDFVLGVKDLSAVGIIVNEILTNAMKHAFLNKNSGRIFVSAAQAVNHVTMIIEDNGIGLPQAIDFEHPSGFGLMLVGTLIKQLNGSIRMDGERGTKFVIEFDA